MNELVFKRIVGDIQRSGWATFEMNVNAPERAQVAERCATLRDLTNKLLDAHVEHGIPEEVVYATHIRAGEPGQETIEELQAFQAQRNKAEKFARVSTELTLADTDDPSFPDDPEDVAKLVSQTRQEAIQVGLQAARMFNLDPNSLSVGNTEFFERMQFIHTWYEPNGYLFGASGFNRGHTDTPYTGMTLSLNLNPESTADWTIDGKNGRRRVTQTGDTVVAMIGKVNPYHLVEVPRKAPPREAVLFRLAGPHIANVLAAAKS